jgi:hypothetical protein
MKKENNFNLAFVKVKMFVFNVFAFYLVSKEKLKSFKFASHVLPPRSSFSSQEVTWQKLLILKEGKNRVRFQLLDALRLKNFNAKSYAPA